VSTRIRLARGGTKKRPFYRIVVTDRRAPRDGRFVERIGSYDPRLEENKSTIDLERAQYWLSTGAEPSDRVRKLLALHGVGTDESAGAAAGPKRSRKSGAAVAAAPAAEATE